MTDPRRLLLMSGCLLGAFGLGFLLVPDLVLLPYGVELDESGRRFVRMFASAALGLAVLALAARRAGDPGSTRVAGTALLAFFVVKTIVSAEAVLGGMFNVLGWSILAIDAPMATLWALALRTRDTPPLGQR